MHALFIETETERNPLILWNMNDVEARAYGVG